MINLLREILWAVIEVIRQEISFRRFLRNLKDNPPESTKWRDAVSSVTLDEWKERVYALHAEASQSFYDPPEEIDAAKALGDNHDNPGNKTTQVQIDLAL